MEANNLQRFAASRQPSVLLVLLCCCVAGVVFGSFLLGCPVFTSMREGFRALLPLLRLLILLRLILLLLLLLRLLLTTDYCHY